MEQLIYVSTAYPSVAGGDVFDIIQKSATRNRERGVTGFLVFTNGLFFQYVEGETAALDGLLSVLSTDPRHYAITVLHRAPRMERAFPDWTMKRLFASQQSGAPEVLLEQLTTLGIPAEPLREVERYLTVRAA
jgi:Sensors of blue-light using FAD